MGRSRLLRPLSTGADVTELVALCIHSATIAVYATVLYAVTVLSPRGRQLVKVP
jgi:hypothetical protein